MIISDLNYLETASADVVGAHSYNSVNTTTYKQAFVNQYSGAYSETSAVFGDDYGYSYYGNSSSAYSNASSSNSSYINQ
ncbi:MAG: hypothetical protein KME06_03085 [Kastovskya adunca ATA6-11-RM4]|jgi:hypothetical protein|nr:hypothetical protein [Kastovskya adunca ATA6-11-RM4]